MTIGKPSVVKALPSTDAPNLPHTSLPKKSAFGLFWLPYCVSQLDRAAAAAAR